MSAGPLHSSGARAQRATLPSSASFLSFLSSSFSFSVATEGSSRQPRTGPRIWGVPGFPPAQSQQLLDRSSSPLAPLSRPFPVSPRDFAFCKPQRKSDLHAGVSLYSRGWLSAPSPCGISCWWEYMTRVRPFELFRIIEFCSEVKYPDQRVENNREAASREGPRSGDTAGSGGLRVSAFLPARPRSVR